MSRKFTIKPPNWPRELTFVEFSRLNPHIKNENQLIQLYNQYLNKYLEELRQKKVHFKQSLNNHLLNELRNNKFNDTLDDFQDSYDGDAAIAPLNLQTFIKFEGNTGRTFGRSVAADYVELPEFVETRRFHRGFTVSFLARFDETETTGFSRDQKFVLGRGSSPLSQIRFGIEGNPDDGNHFNIGVGSTTVSDKKYGPLYNVLGSGNGFGFGSGTELLDLSKFNHYALKYNPDNPFDTTTSGSVKFYINGVLTGSFDTTFTPKFQAGVAYDPSASNYSGGENIFVGAHNQFRVLAGNVDNYKSVQPTNTATDDIKYNNNISGYYDGMACAVDELFFSNVGVWSDNDIKSLYDDAISGQDLSKVSPPDSEGQWTSYGIGYYQFNGNLIDSSNTIIQRNGTFKENATNIGVTNYGLEGESDEVVVTFNENNEDEKTITIGNAVLGNKYEKKTKDNYKIARITPLE